ncbi:MAG: rRNA maturation RNase YbeY [SAR324 cluster bacterium]|nr:rRNA maturation RNase YbeY [SAR324 cluster bacterium]
MIDINLAPGIKNPVPTKKMKHALGLFLRVLEHTNQHLSVYLTHDKEMAELNQQYRQKNKPTDILSWSYWEDSPESGEFGELAVSMDRVREQAVENGWDEKTELFRLLAHGCAHLAGYDHEISETEEKRMLLVEQQMLVKIELGHLYGELGE